MYQIIMLVEYVIHLNNLTYFQKFSKYLEEIFEQYDRRRTNH